MTERSPVDILNREHFEEVVIDSDQPALIDFWAPWCGPCRMTAPAFEAAAKSKGDQVIFAKVNTEQAQDVAAAFNIRSIPTLIALHRGKVFDVHVGATNQAALEKMAERVLAHAEKQAKKESEPSVGLVGKLKRMFGGA